LNNAWFAFVLEEAQCELKHLDPSLFVAAPGMGATLIQQSAYMMLAVTARANCPYEGKGPGFSACCAPFDCRNPIESLHC
jgi:hypothetical protein